MIQLVAQMLEGTVHKSMEKRWNNKTIYMHEQASDRVLWKVNN